ncbi:MAG: hypothetical protein H8D71_01070, partial [Deltaproteobacteria bacterium]|nr:hypothetical protein [Deltaproteobacteria bacterium]
MVRLSVGVDVIQLDCADDGAFPDATPNDSVFHCAGLLPVTVTTKQRWSSTLSTQGQDGEPIPLGEFSYGGGGFHFATVNLKDPASSNSTPFSPPSPGVEQALEPPHAVVPPPEYDLLPPVHVNVESENEGAAPAAGIPSSGTPQGDGSWKWLLGALTLGWAIGKTRKNQVSKGVFKREKGKEGLVVLPVSAVDGNGPTPAGAPVVIASANSVAMATHMIAQLTLRRRVVVTGIGEFLKAEQGHPVLSVTDPDRRSIQRTLENLKNDGGVPPVLFILGADSVIDSSGFSPTPVEDLIYAVGGEVWVALFIGFGETPP